MQSNVQYLGEFWNPNQSNIKLGGTLYFENSIILLKCFNAPIPETKYMYDELNFHKPFPLIYGRNLQLNCINLINLRLHSFKSKGSFNETTYEVEYISIGNSFIPSLSENIISYSMMNFYRMNEFVKFKTIQWKNFFTPRRKRSLDITQAPPKSIYKTKDKQFYLWHQQNINGVENPEDNFIYSEFFLNTSYKKRIDFNALIENKKAIEAFFSIVTAKPKCLKKINFKINKDEFEILDRIIIDVREKDIKHYNETIIQLKDLEDLQFKPLIYWIENFKKIEHSFYLYEDAIYNYKYIPIKSYFLNLFFSIETILKIAVGFIEPKVEVPQKVIDILNEYPKISKNHKDCLLSKFKKANSNVSLYFQEIERRLPLTTKKIFVENFIDTINKAKKTRDTFVHKINETESTIITDEVELLKIAQKLRVLFQAICLLYMGFDDAKINKMLFRYPPNQFC